MYLSKSSCSMTPLPSGFETSVKKHWELKFGNNANYIGESQVMVEYNGYYIIGFTVIDFWVIRDLDKRVYQTIFSRVYIHSEVKKGEAFISCEQTKTALRLVTLIVFLNTQILKLWHMVSPNSTEKQEVLR